MKQQSLPAEPHPWLSHFFQPSLPLSGGSYSLVALKEFGMHNVKLCPTTHYAVRIYDQTQFGPRREVNTAATASCGVLFYFQLMRSVHLHQ